MSKIYLVQKIIEREDGDGNPITFEHPIAAFDNKGALEEFMKLHNYPKMIGFNLEDQLTWEEIDLYSKAKDVDYTEKYERQPLIEAKYVSVGNGKYHMFLEGIRKICSNEVKISLCIWREGENPDTQSQYLGVRTIKNSDTFNIDSFFHKKELEKETGLPIGASINKAGIRFYDKNMLPITDWEKGIYF